MANGIRIELVNWRVHGDDESYVHYEFLRPEENFTFIDEKQQDARTDCRYHQDEDCPWCVVFVNDELTFSEGDEFTDSNGRKYRLRFEEM